MASLIELIPFVKEKRKPEVDADSASIKTKEKCSSKNLNGAEIRGFYESIVGESSQSSPDSETSLLSKAQVLPQSSTSTAVRKHCKLRQNGCVHNSNSKSNAQHGSKRSSDAQVKSATKVKVETVESLNRTVSNEDYFKLLNLLLRAAQSGDAPKIEEALNQGADINGQDQYGWTALMCAAHAGSCSAVRLLLDRQAYSTVWNNRGHTAWDIARCANKTKAVHLLENYSSLVEEEKLAVEAAEVLETFHCDVCQKEVCDISKSKHYCSLVHQLNAKHKVRDTAFAIPECNRGYQLMLKSGWNEDQGLGPDGKGQLYPVKTHLKRDRSGLGEQSKNKTKVTHFKANDERSVTNTRQMRDITLGKRAASKKAKLEKEFERNFRLEFSDFN